MTIGADCRYAASLASCDDIVVVAECTGSVIWCAGGLKEPDIILLGARQISTAWRHNCSALPNGSRCEGYCLHRECEPESHEAALRTGQRVFCEALRAGVDRQTVRKVTVENSA